MYYTFEKRNPHPRQLCNSNCSQLKILIPSLCGAICFVSSTSALDLGSEQGTSRGVEKIRLTVPATASTASASKPLALTRSPKETQYNHHLPSACPREWHFALERQQEQAPSKISKGAATNADQNSKHAQPITHTSGPRRKSLALLRDAPARVVRSCCVKAPDSISSRCPSGPSILKYPNASECRLDHLVSFKGVFTLFLRWKVILCSPLCIFCRSVKLTQVRPFDIKVLDPILVFALHKAILTNCQRELGESLEKLGETIQARETICNRKHHEDRCLI